MTFEQFFEKFELFADAPDSIAKMRQLILELAIQGSIVPHNAGDEPASALLTRIEKLSSVQARQIRKQAALPPVSDDAYLKIPEGWAWTRLGNTGRIFNGDSVSESGKGELAEVEDGLPFIATKDVGYGRDTLVYDNGLKVPCGDPRFKVAHANSVLICAEGGSAGRKIGIADRDICFGNKLFTNEVREGIHHRYIFYVYQAPRFYRQFAARMTGIIGGIARSEFLLLPIPLPPEEEQKRIVEKVDELMVLCDRLEVLQQERETRHAALARASLARFADAPTSANLNFLFHPSYTIVPTDLRKSILTLAVQGKLVPQDPNDEPVEELLVRSLTERRKLKCADATKVQALAGNDVLGYDIPESWRWQRLYDLLIFGPTNGISPKAVDYETTVRSLTLSATTSGRFKGQHSKFITTDVPADSDLWLSDGDILVQRGNTIEYVGVAAVYHGEPNCFVYPDLMMKLRVSSAFDVGYVHLAMSHDAARDFLRARASGTSGSMPKINQTTLKSLPLPIPPLAEQRRIVAKVDQLMSLVDQLETQLTESKAKAQKLLDAVIHELLYPRAEIIEFPRDHQSRVWERAAIGCYIIRHMIGNRHFGKVMLMKLFYLSEAHLDRSLGGEYMRHVAGPWDPWIDQFEELGRQHDWFEVISHNISGGRTKIEYRTKAGLEGKVSEAETLLGGQRTEFDRVLSLFSNKRTEEAEIIATLFAAWNDALIDGRQPSDQDIILEVRENWHEKKARFTPETLTECLAWIRQNQLIPKGREPRTKQQASLAFDQS